MDEEYDVIVLGTGLKECILSGMLSQNGKKVLHLDRNTYYGGESATLPLDKVFEMFSQNYNQLGEQNNRDWNVEMTPKFLMSDGPMVKILNDTGVGRLLRFQNVDGSYVYTKEKETILKVPTNEQETIASELIAQSEKMKYVGFLKYCDAFDENNTSTHYGLDNSKDTMRDCFKAFGLNENTQYVIGHAIALYSDDNYKDEIGNIPKTIARIKLYFDSFNGSSPYVYPLYGLGQLPEGFSRLSAIFGGTYMLDKAIDGIEYDRSGKVIGVKSEGNITKCKQMACDPYYCPELVENVGKVVRAICFLDHPIPNTNDDKSCQIIVPANQVDGRSNDIHVVCVSSDHLVAPSGWYIATVTTSVETSNPEEELQPGMKILGNIVEKIVYVSEMFKPSKQQEEIKQVFVSESYDATTNFETICNDVQDIYKRMTSHE